MAKSSKKSKIHLVPAPPDGGYGWVVLAACFFISFIVDGCMYSIGIVLGDIKKHYGVSQEIVNLLPSLNTGFLFCSGPIVAGLSNQFGIRPVVMGGAMVTSLVYVLSAFSPSIYFMMITYGVIGGISTGCTYIASLIVIVEYFDKLKGVATGICMAGSGVGAFAFSPIMQFLVSYFDWKTTMIILGAILLQCCIMGALLRPGPKVPSKQIEMSTMPKAQDETNVTTFTGSMMSVKSRDVDADDEEKTSCLSISIKILKEMTDVKLLCQNVGFLFITMSGFFIFAGYFIPFLFIPIRARDELGIQNYSLILSVIGIINIPARLGFGFLADRKILSAVNLNFLCIIIATVPVWLYGLMNSFALQIVFAVFFAIGIAGMNCLMTPYLTEIVEPKKFGNSVGILNLFRGFGCFLGPFLSGIIADKTKSTLAAFYYNAIAFTIGGVFGGLITIMSFFKNRRNKGYQLPTNN